LKEPSQDRPAARGVNPSFARLLGDERGHGKGEWTGAADVTQIQKWRMDRHGPPLQQRAQAVAIAHINDAAARHQHSKGAGDER
jgi:hypothetical protein